MTRVFIGVGSNIDPGKNVPEAVRRICERIRIIAASTFYRTPPVDGRAQPDFRNGVLAAEVDETVSPSVLKFDILRGVERGLGRTRSADRYASRTMDLDILLYGRLVLRNGDLQIPDPDIRKRPFLAVCLLELEPELELPDTGEPLFRIEAVRRTDGLEPDTALTKTVRALIAGGLQVHDDRKRGRRT